MRLTFYGAAREVTGSMHLVETNGYRVLLDCGMLQGHRADANARNANLPFNAATITHTLLSHAHIDHSGNLPTLVKDGFKGSIQCTSATRALAALMLRDAAKIQEEDADFLNRHHAQPPVQPIYTTLDANHAIQHLATHEYQRSFTLTQGNSAAVGVMFFDAGHILGSEITRLEVNENGNLIRLGFTGDLGRKGSLIIRDPAPAPELEYLLIEGTYGDRVHPPQEQAIEELTQVIQETSARGGKIVIPAFAVERTQEIVYLLNLQQQAGKLGRIPIFVDSPLAIDATDVFRMHPECFDDQLREFMLTHKDPWGFRQLVYTRTVDESKAINRQQGPAVIIASNGMVEAGRILHHVKHNITDERNTILFVGYQADGTLGRRIKDGAKEIRILGETVPVRAQIASAEGFSAHADHNELIDWVRPIAQGLRGVFVVHAEPEAGQALAEGIRELGVSQVLVPERGQSVDLE